MDKEAKDARMRAIGEKFRKLRKEAGYKNYDHIAYDLNISRNQVSRIERGENITMETFLLMLDAYGLSLAEFFAEFDEKKEAGLERMKGEAK